MTKKEWLIAAILTFATIVAWMVFDVIHARSRVEIPGRVQQIIDPIDPNFNTQSLESSP